MVLLTNCLGHCMRWCIIRISLCNRVFPKRSRTFNEVNSAYSENLRNHWNIHLVKIKNPLRYRCLPERQQVQILLFPQEYSANSVDSADSLEFIWGKLDWARTPTVRTVTGKNVIWTNADRVQIFNVREIKCRRKPEQFPDFKTWQLKYLKRCWTLKRFKLKFKA